MAIDSYACISKNGHLYEVKLKCLDGTILYEGYRDLSQLGRYRSLTIGSTTRLYTNVYFAIDANMMVMREIFQGELDYKIELMKNTQEGI